METLEELENYLFVLQMQDVWSNDDYTYANELREKIKKIKESKNGNGFRKNESEKKSF